MLIAHMPAGYIVTTLFVDKISHEKSVNLKVVWFFGMLFSVIPDLDLVYFYFVDSSYHHHKLFPHIPLFWVCFFAPIYGLAYYLKNMQFFYILLISSLNILVHLLLDTFVGFVWWLYPFMDKPFYVVKIPANYNHWIASFMMHWSFGVEIVIVALAIYLLRKR